VIEYQDYNKSYFLACEKCGRNDAVRTARSLDQAKHIASVFFKWATDTPLGVLCPSCTVLWRDGVLERNGMFERERVKDARHFA
jgi:hypothetical protein